MWFSRNEREAYPGLWPHAETAQHLNVAVPAANEQEVPDKRSRLLQRVRPSVVEIVQVVEIVEICFEASQLVALFELPAYLE